MKQHQISGSYVLTCKHYVKDHTECPHIKRRFDQPFGSVFEEFGRTVGRRSCGHASWDAVLVAIANFVYELRATEIYDFDDR